MAAAKTAFSRGDFMECEREAATAGEWIRSFNRGNGGTKGEFHSIQKTKFGRFSVNLNRILFDAVIVENSRLRAAALRALHKWNESIGRNGGNVEP